MPNKSRMLRSVFAAVLAVSVVFVSAAQAAEFTASAGAGANLSGTQTGAGHVFTAAGQSVTCNTASFSGTTTAASYTTQTITPTYSGCTAFGFIGATVTGFGAGECDYLFKANETVDLVCAAGKSVVVDAGPCVLTIKSFTGKKTSAYVNNPNHITITTTLTGVEFDVHKGFLCPASGGSTEIQKNGSYVGTTTLTVSTGTIFWDK